MIEKCVTDCGLSDTEHIQQVAYEVLQQQEKRMKNKKNKEAHDTYVIHLCYYFKLLDLKFSPCFSFNMRTAVSTVVIHSSDIHAKDRIYPPCT